MLCGGVGGANHAESEDGLQEQESSSRAGLE